MTPLSRSLYSLILLAFRKISALSGGNSMTKRKRNLPASQRKPQAGSEQLVSKREVTYSFFEGDYPPPDILKEYPDEVTTSLVKLTEKEQVSRHAFGEKEQAHRHEFNESNLRSVTTLRIIGMVCGTVLALTTIISGAILLANDKGLLGFGVLLMAGAGLVGTAIYGHKAKRPNKEEKPSE